MTNNKEIEKEIKNILITIESLGYEAYIVGGAVRDKIIGKEINDYDICTNMPLDKIKDLYPRFHLMKQNERRQVGVFNINGIQIEIAEFKGKNIIEDLSNRDFTINAIAMDKDGNIVDPFGGIDSLRKKDISLIKKTGETFTIDPLRILRAIRIAAKLNFNIDENCRCEMQKKEILLTGIAPERIYRELIQILITGNPSKYIRDNIHIFFQILPELKPLQELEQHNPSHKNNVLDYTLAVLENTPKNIFLRLAALFHDIGKPESFSIGEDGIGHFYDHSEISAIIFDSISSRLKMDNKTRKIVRKLIEKHDIVMSKIPSKIYQFIRENGIEFTRLLFELKKAKIKAQGQELSLPTLDELIELEKRYFECIIIISNLQINTDKISELGIKGKKTKIIIEDIIKQILQHTINNSEEEIIRYIKHHK